MPKVSACRRRAQLSGEVGGVADPRVWLGLCQVLMADIVARPPGRPEAADALSATALGPPPIYTPAVLPYRKPAAATRAE